MWVAKFSLIHDCILGKRCIEYGVSSQGVYLNHEIKDGAIYVYSFHQLSGRDSDIRKLYNGLKKEEKVVRSELNGHAMFLVERTKDTPSEFYDPNMFLIEPVIVDEKGWEHWEVASFDRKLINSFIDKTEKHSFELKIHSIRKEKLKDVYFLTPQYL